MKLLGLTGGIGMGKSTVADLLVARGVPVVDTDVVARQVVEPGQPALEEIRAGFGDAVIGNDGRLRREVVAKLVFGDPDALQRLEAILHPRIRQAWMAQVQAWREQQVPLSVVVIPLLYERGAEAAFDQVIAVACSAASQHQRLLARGWSVEEIRRRLAAQWPIEKKIALAPFMLWSEGGLNLMARQLDRVLASVF